MRKIIRTKRTNQNKWKGLMLVHKLLLEANYAYPTSNKPYKTEKGSKCGKITVEPKEPISITNPTVVKIC